MNIKETFLKLTEYTIPHGQEDTLRKYLPANSQRDQFGNYFLMVGNSETLFTSHLDTYCRKMEKVNHVINDNIIATDETTVLGGDNKTGVVILLNMIEHNIPGTYYFFSGEEPTAKDGGLYGSKNALASNPAFFKRFKRAVCFDRKKEGSIVTRQMARYTSSNEFVQSLIDQFDAQGLEFHPDETGWYTDTAVFLNIIPEVTNLSSGTHNEHTVKEYVDIEYLEKVAEAALHIDWENLPTVREPRKETSRTADGASIHTFKKFKNIKNDQKVFSVVNSYLGNMGFLCLNDDEFEPGLNMIFSQWHKELRIYIKVEDGIISFNDQRVGTLIDFERALGIGFSQKVDVDEFLEVVFMAFEKYDTENIKIDVFKKYFDKFGTSEEEFLEFYNSEEGTKIKEIIKYNPRTKKITLM